MILILSRGAEFSTDQVGDWIDRLGGSYVRVHESDLRDLTSPFGLRLSNEKQSVVFGSERLQFAPEDINVVWYRKWVFADDLLEFHQLTDNKIWANNLLSHMNREVISAGNQFFDLFAHCKWLDPPDKVRQVRKQEVLAKAGKAGLRIPDSLVTNSREEALGFRTEKGRLISKPISDIVFFEEKDYVYLIYTKEVTEELLLAAPAFFYPSLFQELIEKKADIRAFYLDGEIYSMAILSQRDNRTAIDFRNYNFSKPNRTVPYRLPADIEASIRVLMREIGLSCGSLDLILSTSGEHVFLEVNPVGQFGMVSRPCNYQLERRLAEYLIKEDKPNLSTINGTHYANSLSPA